MTANSANGINRVNGHSTTHQPLSGKTAIVTGASRGIGAGIALLLGSRGANVVVNYTSPKSKSRAEKVASTVQEQNPKAQAIAVQADVTSSTGHTALVEAARQLSPTQHIDILVHNAGDGDDCYLADLTETFYYKQTDLNIKAPIFLTQSCLSHIPRGGRIIIISSVSSRMGVPQQTVYAATKAANEAFARVWATELGQSKGITVNCVNPGPIATDGYYASDQDFIDALKPMIDSTPAAARIGEVDDIAPVVAFLAGEESRWVTGQNLSVSGGLAFY